MTFTVTDSGGLSASAQRSLLVNSAPDAPVVAISPALPTTLDPLVAEVVGGGKDVDRKPSDLTLSYAWRLNGQPTSWDVPTLPAKTAHKGEI